MSGQITHRLPRHWLKIAITCPASISQLLASRLSQLTTNGTETLTVEKGIMVIAYLEKDDNYLQKRQEIDQDLNQLCASNQAISVERSTIVEENWAEQWKSQFKPTKISPIFTVTPSWEPCPPIPGQKIITIDPGLAFGTGLHASTHLALLHLEKCLATQTEQTISVLDVGTGTAILAIAAAMLAAQPVVAIDNDPDAVAAAQANCAQNQLQQIQVSTTPLAKINNQFKVVIANITADILTMLSQELVAHLSDQGYLILSGILAGGQGDNIVTTFTDLGLSLVSTEQQGEWISFLLRPTTKTS